MTKDQGSAGSEGSLGQEGPGAGRNRNVRSTEDGVHRHEEGRVGDTVKEGDHLPISSALHLYCWQVRIITAYKTALQYQYFVF